ncbi:MAG: ChbG/HpnK family deacetylase [Aestuariibacter sp.]
MGSCANGIATTTEIMVPCPWFEGAVTLLKEHPEIDVGVHLTLNAEWDKLKWRRLTHCPSLVDFSGYFYLSFNNYDCFPTELSLLNQGWKLNEVKTELQAHIELYEQDRLDL